MSQFAALNYATKNTNDEPVSKQIFINLPVADPSKSIAFFKALGFSQTRSSPTTLVRALSLATRFLSCCLRTPGFVTSLPKPFAIRARTLNVLLSLDCDSRDKVDSLVAKAVAAGGSTYDEPEDFGFMYTHSFIDLDGRGWGLLHMSAMPIQK